VLFFIASSKWYWWPWNHNHGTSHVPPPNGEHLATPVPEFDGSLIGSVLLICVLGMLIMGAGRKANGR